MVWLAFAGVRFAGRRPKLWTFYFLATASHGLLDAFTTGGGGVAFLAPFSAERFFFPWRPIAVSPISIRRFLSERGVRVLASELRWVLLPSAAFACAALLTGDDADRPAPMAALTWRLLSPAFAQRPLGVGPIVLVRGLASRLRRAPAGAGAIAGGLWLVARARLAFVALGHSGTAVTGLALIAVASIRGHVLSSS